MILDTEAMATLLSCSRPCRSAHPRQTERAARSSRYRRRDRREPPPLKDLLAKPKNCGAGMATQMCESFHSRKSKFACKDFAWQGRRDFRGDSGHERIQLAGEVIISIPTTTTASANRRRYCCARKESSCSGRPAEHGFRKTKGLTDESREKEDDQDH
jgi:hypothetical protein